MYNHSLKKAYVERDDIVTFVEILMKDIIQQKMIIILITSHKSYLYDIRIICLRENHPCNSNLNFFLNFFFFPFFIYKSSSVLRFNTESNQINNFYV